MLGIKLQTKAFSDLRTTTDPMVGSSLKQNNYCTLSTSALLSTLELNMYSFTPVAACICDGVG